MPMVSEYWILCSTKFRWHLYHLPVQLEVAVAVRGADVVQQGVVLLVVALCLRVAHVEAAAGVRLVAVPEQP